MTDWLSASAMLAAGLIVGFMFLYGMKRRQAKPDTVRADLEAKRDALVARLREDPSDRRLELEAAEVLKKLDGLGGGQAILPVPTGKSAGPTQVKGFLWGAGSMAALAAIAFFVVQQAKPKEAMAPANAPANDALGSLQRSVQQNPDNLGLRDDLAKAYLDRDDLNGVAEQTRYVLQRNPNDARALTYQALVHIAARQPEAASAMLQKATTVDPNQLDAWVGLAWLNAESGNMAGAQAAIDEGKKRHPEQAARLDELMNHLRPQTPVHVTISLGDGVTAPPGGVIFVIARAAGVTAGPPAAVKRLPLGTFPITVDLTASDSMMGQPLPAKMRIEARIDSDGNPMTKDPRDPSGWADGVALGQSISLTLK
jgi:hypothetical protein